jgi:hypothetical protein
MHLKSLEPLPHRLAEAPTQMHGFVHKDRRLSTRQRTQSNALRHKSRFCTRGARILPLFQIWKKAGPLTPCDKAHNLPLHRLLQGHLELEVGVLKLAALGLDGGVGLDAVPQPQRRLLEDNRSGAAARIGEQPGVNRRRRRECTHLQAKQLSGASTFLAIFCFPTPLTIESILSLPLCRMRGDSGCSNEPGSVSLPLGHAHNAGHSHWTKLSMNWALFTTNPPLHITACRVKSVNTLTFSGGIVLPGFCARMLCTMLLTELRLSGA